jgi:N-acetylglucosaminyl-diphospho-decaprenol L-rhamnosyltransferase
LAADANTDIDVSIVIVSRNTRDVLRASLRSIAAHAGDLRTETIVVDALSTDGTPAMIRQEFPDVLLLQPAENTGFSRGNNIGIRRARGTALLLLNPDTELTPGALATLVAALKSASDLGVVGPRLRYPDGSVQPSRRRFPTLMTAAVESTIVQEWLPDHSALARYTMADLPVDAPHDVDWLVGACLLARREVFETAGLLDERLFLYAEEPEWCWRVRRAGWRVRYIPAAEVIHHEGASTSQNVTVRQRAFATSKAHVMARIYGPATGLLTRGILVVDQSARLVREGAKWALGHKRSLRAARVTAAWCTLRALLLPGSNHR